MISKVSILLTVWTLVSFLETGNAERSIIPPGLLKRVAAINNTEEFIRNFLRNKAGCKKGMKGCSDFDINQASDVEIIAGSVSSPSAQSGCQPQQKLVEIRPKTDPNVINFPDCEELPQCGGCCVNDVLVCTPTLWEEHTRQVVIAKYPHPGADYFEFDSMETVKLLHHHECKCLCKVTEDDCNPEVHDYINDECRCKCRNENEADKCEYNKKWNDDICSCECREIHQCHSDEFFDKERCRCELLSNAPAEDVATNPCAEMRCRQGFVPTRTGINTCMCASGADSQQGSIRDPIVPRQRESDTPTRPPRRQRPGRRPSSDRNTGGIAPIVPRG